MDKTYRIFVIAGELSGDMHAAELVKGILSKLPATKIIGWGGDHMQKAGAEIKTHIKHLAYMGIWEVVRNFPEILKNFRRCKNDIIRFRPDALICVDYPGFNLRIGKWAKKRGIKTIYYIPPKVWAWNSTRVRLLKKYFDLILCILPIEFKFLKARGVNCYFVGHPALNRVKSFKLNPLLFPEEYKNNLPVIALLPGSRNQEVRRILPDMLSAVSKLHGYQIGISTVNHIPEKMSGNKPEIFLFSLL